MIMSMQLKTLHFLNGIEEKSVNDTDHARHILFCESKT